MRRDACCSIPAILALLLIALPLAPNVLAQEDDAGDDSAAPVADSGRLGVLYAEFGVWVAQPVGLDYAPATRNNPNDPFDTKLLTVGHGTDDRPRVRVGWMFNNAIGEFVLTYYSHQDREDRGETDPGRFVFGEVLSHPINAGFNDDGLSDSYFDDTTTLLRDLRLDYYRPAFENSRASAKWFVGLRRVYHKREQNIEYNVLVPSLPPLLPPLTVLRPSLVPLPDVVEIESAYEGRGVEAGLDFLVPLWKDRFTFEAGFAVAALRGETDTRYESATHFYARVVNNEIVEVIEPPFTRLEEFVIPGDSMSGKVIDDTEQLSSIFALQALNRSTTSMVVEGYLGFRYRAWRTLELIGGFRDVHYSHAGVDLQPRQVTVSSSNQLNLQDVTETSRDAGYEGFYISLAYSY